jgi:hypothetical protein
MSSSEREQPIDLWAEQRGEVAVLVGQLQPGEALEILRRVRDGVYRRASGCADAPGNYSRHRGAESGPNLRGLTAPQRPQPKPGALAGMLYFSRVVIERNEHTYAQKTRITYGTINTRFSRS